MDKKIHKRLVALLTAAALMAGAEGTAVFAEEEPARDEAVEAGGIYTAHDTEAAPESAEEPDPEQTAEELREEFLENEELFAEDTIILEGTGSSSASRLAEQLGAGIRFSPDGEFAVLRLPEGMTARDVFEDPELEEWLPNMMPDRFVESSEADGQLGSVSRARPDFGIDDPHYPAQTYLEFLDLKDTWETAKGEGVTVALIDSGIDTDHPEFEGRISPYSYNASEDKIVKDYDLSVIEDEYGHGTAAAGVIAASFNNSEGIAGIAPEAELLVIKCEVSDGRAEFRSSDIIFGVAYAIEQDVDIINMSFCSPDNYLQKYIDLATDSDIICIASAGNESSPVPVYPASLDNVIGVGAFDTDTMAIADYSNYGENVDLLAPGTVFTTDIGGGYNVVSGTSFAGPIVTAAAALYLSQHPDTDTAELREMLGASCTDIGTVGRDYVNGFGLLDIHALVCEEKGRITYDMLTDELENTTQPFVKGRGVQYMVEPEREYVVYDGWFFDPNCTDECDPYTNIFTEDVTLYAKWINEDESTAYVYTVLDDGTVELCSYTGKRRYLTVLEEIGGRRVTSIGEECFADRRSLRELVLPSGLKNIGYRAFTDCTALRRLELPDSVQTIGANAFAGCSRLGQVSIGRASELRSVGEEAFEYTGISSFYIPSKLETLGARTFFGSTALREISAAADNGNYIIKNNALYTADGSSLVYYPAARTGAYTVDAATVSIGDSAFAYSRAGSITLNDGLTAIGDSAFAFGRLTSAKIPDSVSSLGKEAFANSSVASVTFPENGSFTDIPFCAFYCCTDLRQVTIPKYISSIDTSAFASSGLDDLDLSKAAALKEIGEGAFAFISIKSLELPSGLVTVGKGAFQGNFLLSRVVFPSDSSCTEIFSSAFETDYQLKDVTLPAALEYIGELAFSESGLASVNIGSKVREIGEGAFGSCQSLKAITADSGSAYFTVKDGVLYSKDMKTLVQYPAGKAGSTFTLPNSVTKLAGSSFAGASSLEDVTLNDGLKAIERSAFENCAALTTPVLPETLEEIGVSAFAFCPSFSGTLTIPKAVHTIGSYAFNNDYALEVIDFEPESEMDRLGFAAFACCGIKDFTIPANVSTIGLEVFSGCKKLLAVTFEADSLLEAVPAWAFGGADELRQVTFEDGCALKRISARAFDGLTKLQKVDVSNCTKLEEIDNYAFYFCRSLADIKLPASLRTIGRYAFYGCSSLSELSISEGIEKIGRFAFEKTAPVNVYFKGAVLSSGFEQNWDSGTGAYYVGVENVITSGSWQYALTDDGKASVIRYTGTESEVVIDSIDGHDVVSIGGDAFADTAVTSVTLPDTLTGIYKGAFRNTPNLGSIVIPDSVTVIESDAFKGSGLSEISFGSGSRLAVLGTSAFEDTVSLRSIKLPSGLAEIRENTFRNSALTEITLPSGLKEIGRQAFAESGLASIRIPAGVTEIAAKAFKNTAALRSAVFEDGTAQLMIRDEAFYGSGLESVTIPARAAFMGELCFADCKNLAEINTATENTAYKSVDGVLYNKQGTRLIACPAGKSGSYTVPAEAAALAFGAFEGSQLSEIIIPEDSRLNTLGHRAFYNCTELESISIPAGVQSIDHYAFAYCGKLKNVKIADGCRLSGIYTGAFYNCSSLGYIDIPDPVKEISDYAFYGCESLTGVGLGADSRLKGVYDHAFEYSGLEGFDMPEGVLEIGSYAFRGTKLKTFGFNDAVTDIGEMAFADSGLTEMKSLVIPSSVQYIGKYILDGVSSLEEITLPFLGESIDGKDARLGYTFNVHSFTDNDTVSGLKKVTVLGGRVWDDSALEGFCIEEAVMPDTVEEVKTNTFAFCYYLKKVKLSANLRNLGRYMFHECPDLEELTIPESCATIETGALNCGIMRLALPKSVSVIADDAFIGCKRLTEISIDENNKSFKLVDGILYNSDMTRIVIAERDISGRLEIPDTVTEFDRGAFANCTELTEAVLPKGLKTIKADLFRGCTGIKAIDLPDGLELIESSAFQDCTALESIEIPAGVSLIGPYAFQGCHALKEATFAEGSKLDKLEVDVFYSCYSLESVNIPDTVTELGVQCFALCRSLKEIALPDALKTINREVFNECSSLESIYIPANVSEIGEQAFSNCGSLSAIGVDEANKHFSSVDGLLYTYDKTRLMFVPKAISGEIELPEGITEIDSNAFKGCDGLTSVSLPDSLERLGDDVFCDCTRLSEITAGPNLTEIGRECFFNTAYANDLDNYYYGLLYVGDYAVGITPIERYIPEELKIREGTVLVARIYTGNDTVKSIYMPDSLRYIGALGFPNVKAIKWSKNLERIGSYGISDTKIISAELLCPDYVFVDQNIIGNSSLKYVKTAFNVLPEWGMVISGGCDITTYVGCYSTNAAPRADNIVLENMEQFRNSYVADSDANVFVRLGRDECRSIDNSIFTENIFYKGEWDLATFYVNGNIVSMLPLKTGEMVQAPAQALINEYLPDGAKFTGWDINGDGAADKLPATLSEDLVAEAVFDAPVKSICIIAEGIYESCDEDDNRTDTINIENGGTAKLRAEFHPALNNHSEELVWSSGDESLLTVDQDGRLTAVKSEAYDEYHTVIVRCAMKEDPSVYAEISVYIMPRSYGIKLEESKGVVNAGESMKLEPVFDLPEDQQDAERFEKRFSSSNEAAATVSEDGTVTAVAPGTSEITVAYYDKELGADLYTAVFTVKVKAPMTGISLPASAEVNVEEALTLRPEFLPANTTDKRTVTWSSSDTGIAKVSAGGRVTGVMPGTVTVTARCGSFEAACTVTVKVPLKEITLNTSRGTLRLDKTKQLEVICIPEYTTYDRAAVWRSDNEEIASVDQNGLVTANKTGRTVITAEVGGKTATYEVSVIGLRDEATGITVTNSDDTEMEDGTELVVDELDRDEVGDKYGDMYGAVILLVRDRWGRLYWLYIYDISLFRGSHTVQPTVPVDVDLPVPVTTNGGSGKIYRMEPDGSLTDMASTVSDGKYHFRTEHFSVYALAVPTDSYAAADIQLDRSELTLCLGQEADVQAAVSPEEAEDKTVLWSSSDESVAVVDENGHITAAGKGSAVITAVSADQPDVKAECSVTVTDHSYEAKVTRPATASEEGEMTYTCTHCGDSYTEPIEKLRNSMENMDISLKYTAVTYSAAGINADKYLTVKDGGKTLVQGVDYKTSYKDNDKVGFKTCTLTITGIGDYSGSVEKQLTVKPATLPAPKLSTKDGAIIVNWSKTTTDGLAYQIIYDKVADFDTSAKGHTADYHTTTVTDLNTLTKTLSAYTKPGETWYVRVRTFITSDGTVKGTRYGTFSKSVKIAVKGGLGSASILYSSYTYTGKEIKPAVTVKDSKGSKLKASDYTVTYSNNKVVGKATIKIVGKGSYQGTLTKTFVIKPKAGTLTLTAGKASFKASWTKDTAASGYQITYSKDKSFKSGVTNYNVSKSSTTSANFSSKPKSGETWYVKYRPYITVNGTKYYGSYSSVKTVKAK